MALKKLLHLLLGSSGDDTLELLEDKGFKETYSFDGYVCFENREYKVLYDTIEKQVIDIRSRKYGDLSQ